MYINIRQDAPVIFQGAISYGRKSSGSHEGGDVVPALCLCVHLNPDSLLLMSIICDCPQILKADLKPFFSIWLAPVVFETFLRPPAV